MATTKKNNKRKNQSLTDYVTRLKTLNHGVNKQIKLPKENINTIISKPDDYAIKFIEIALVQFAKNYTAMYNEGKELAKDLEDEKE